MELEAIEEMERKTAKRRERPEPYYCDRGFVGVILEPGPTPDDIMYRKHGPVKFIPELGYEGIFLCTVHYEEEVARLRQAAAKEAKS